MTQYPDSQEHQAIERSASKGNKSAHDYLAILDACIQIVEASKEVGSARNILGEHNFIYDMAISKVLDELMPIIINVAGWDQLKYYMPIEMQQAISQKHAESYEADQRWAIKHMAECQKYLEQTIQQANNQEDKNRITLNYQRSLVHAMMFLTQGTNCACQPVISNMAETAHKLNENRKEANTANFSTSEMQAYIKTSMNLLLQVYQKHVKKLCPVCQERLRYAILTNFQMYNHHEGNNIMTTTRSITHEPINFKDEYYDKSEEYIKLQEQLDNLSDKQLLTIWQEYSSILKELRTNFGTEQLCIEENFYTFIISTPCTIIEEWFSEKYTGGLEKLEADYKDKYDIL